MKDTLENLIRDLTSVAKFPMAKSEVRRRIIEHRQEWLKSILNKDLPLALVPSHWSLIKDEIITNSLTLIGK